MPQEPAWGWRNKLKRIFNNYLIITEFHRTETHIGTNSWLPEGKGVGNEKKKREFCEVMNVN